MPLIVALVICLVLGLSRAEEPVFSVVADGPRMVFEFSDKQFWDVVFGAVSIRDVINNATLCDTLADQLEHELVEMQASHAADTQQLNVCFLNSR